MQLYFHPDLSAEIVELSEEESAHLRVLRASVGEPLLLTDGKGLLAEVEIIAVNKKTFTTRIKKRTEFPRPTPELHLAVALLKNSERMEWLLEKAVEMGITAFYPFVAQRSERKKVNEERLKKIALSAAKQSQRVYFPHIHELTTFEELLKLPLVEHRFICHCNEQTLSVQTLLKKGQNSFILIGAEGDFSENEIEMAIKAKFLSMGLGDARLRSETAGVYVSSAFKLINA